MKKILSLILLISILFSTFAGMGMKSLAATALNITQKEAVNWVLSIYKSPFDYDGTNFSEAQGGDPQCVDLVKYYFAHLGYPIGSIGNTGYAYDLKNNNVVRTHYDVLDNSHTPLPGDVFVWNKYVNGASYTGHTGIITSVDGSNYYYVDWNGAGGKNKAGSGSKPLSSFSYVIRPNFKNSCSTHKWNKGTITTQATCTSDGVKTYTCTVCGETKTETIKGGHKYKVIGRVRATFLVNGAVGRECTVCGKRVKTIVYRPKSVVSNKSRVTYNGKYQYPGVTVKDVKGNVISPKYYTRSYKNNLNAGIAVITVNFKGLYSGTKSVAFKIAPKGNALRAVKTAGYSAINVYWNKQTVQTGGYQIQYSTDSKFSKNNKSFTVKTNTSGKKVTGLKSSTKYYFRIRTYKKALQIPVYSGWSRVLSAKTSIAPDAKSVLLKKVKKITSRPIQTVYYADFDADGKKELFAVSNNSNNGELYFASIKQVKRILKTDSHIHIYNEKTPKVSKKQTLFSVEIGTGGAWADFACYYVKAGKVYGKVYGKKQNLIGLEQKSGSYFTISESALDGGRSKSGIWGFHTFKPYYLKWTGTRFVEYKGKLITKNDIKKYSNGKSVLTQISSAGYIVDKIYRRSNGIININVHKSDSNYTYYDNVNLKISSKSLKLILNNKNADNIVSKSTWGGIYKASVLY